MVSFLTKTLRESPTAQNKITMIIKNVQNCIRFVKNNDNIWL